MEGHADEIKPEIYTRDNHCVSRRDIDQDALKIMYRLIRHGYKAYLVGGGVRDLLLHKPPKDFDIATDALPRKVKALFRNSRIIGRRFKLAHVYFKNAKIIEVATFRDTSTDTETIDPDNPQEKHVIRDNTYGSEATDALRRDVTINALFYDLSNFSIIDYVGGMRDLKDGIIRVIGNPAERFLEDPVRMTRAVRHAVRADFILEDECRSAIVEHGSLIQKAAPMRLFDELKKDFGSGYARPILMGLADAGLLQYILPELVDEVCPLIQNGSPFTEAMGRFDELQRSQDEMSCADALALIALYRMDPNFSEDNLPRLFRNAGEINDYIRECFPQLAVPRKERDRIAEIISLWLMLLSASEKSLRPVTLARRHGLDFLLRVIQAAAPDSEFVAIVNAAENHRKRLNRKQKKKTPTRRQRSRTNKFNKRKPLL